MVQLPVIPETDTQDAFVEAFDDYELIDFGRGRKLERWGDYVVETLDRLAVGEPHDPHWQADWIYVTGVGQSPLWEPTRSGLKKSWQITLNNQTVECRLDPQGRVGLRGRDIPCANWVRSRIEGCYDLDEISVLNFFGGNGYVTAQAVHAGATVVHVDASENMLSLARHQASEQQVEYIHDNVMDYVEDLLRRQRKFDLIVLPAPPLGHGPKGQLWDREVDLPKLIKYLPRLITDNCLGIWLSTDSGAITWKAESLGQLLQEILPGCTIEPLHLGVKTKDGRVLPAGVAARWYDETEFLQTGPMPLTAKQLEERLDAHMVSLGAAEEPARELADFTREQQDFVLRNVAMVGRTSSGMAFNFVSHVCRALRLMDEGGVEAWLLHCMDIYDTRGLHPAVAAFKDAENFAREHKARSTGLVLDDVVNVLEAFVHGLNGRRLKLETGEQTFTDTETLYLPAIISRFESRDDNFQLYKAMVVHLWAQTWYGTWRENIQEAVDRFSDSDKALQCLQALEALRLDAKIKSLLPGVYRYMARLREACDEPMDEVWHRAAEQLADKAATVQDSLSQLKNVIDADVPAATSYQGVLLPSVVEKVRAARLEADKQMFRIGLLKMKNEIVEKDNEAEGETDEDLIEEEKTEEDAEQDQPFKLREGEAR